jgi:hypothetical protein
MRDLKFICAQPDDVYFTWQVHLWLESLRKLGHSDKAIVLVFTPNFREPNDKWQKIVDLYPEAEFAFYRDDDNTISDMLGIYVSVLRPYTLMRYFQDHPEMKEKALFYCDCDVYFTEKFNIDQYVDNDVHYLSDTNSYINARYFDSKQHDVLPNKLEEYKQRDILEETTNLCGITRFIAEKSNEDSGGAQYLLKNIDADFWKHVMEDCISIRVSLMAVNREFFESEDRGFQSWCADMWAVLWNLWRRGDDTKVIPEMEFSWASDPIEKVERLGIFHNAGMVGDYMGEAPTFFKGKYHGGTDPFTDPHMITVYTDERSKRLGTHFYVSKLIELKEKYNLNY